MAGADFGGSNLTADQLYSTASYQAKDLHGIGLDGCDLTGWNLANQNLTGADLSVQHPDRRQLQQGRPWREPTLTART